MSSRGSLLQHTTLHFRGETGLWLNTRAASLSAPITPPRPFESRMRLRYLLGKQTSCRSVRLRPRPRVSCPCWAQYSSRPELSLGGGKKYPALAPPNVAFAQRSNTVEVSGPRGAIGRKGVCGGRKEACPRGCRCRRSELVYVEGASKRLSTGMPRMWVAPAALFVLFDDTAFVSAALDRPPRFGY
jgi:hypothetical protein